MDIDPSLMSATPLDMLTFFVTTRSGPGEEALGLIVQSVVELYDKHRAEFAVQARPLYILLKSIAHIHELNMEIAWLKRGLAIERLNMMHKPHNFWQQKHFGDEFYSRCGDADAYDEALRHDREALEAAMHEGLDILGSDTPHCEVCKTPTGPDGFGRCGKNWDKCRLNSATSK